MNPVLGMSANKKTITGPYRATKLWNDCVRSFYNEMPLSRHWRGLRQYENCFTAMEAITWLHNYLISNPNFGPNVTRDQSIKLLRKFLKSGLLVEARGNKVYAEDFQDNRELFRFSNQSPLKALRTPGRTPLAPIVANALANYGSSPALKNEKRSKVGEWKSECAPVEENVSNERKDEHFGALPRKDVAEDDVDEAWRTTFIEKLESLSSQLMVGGEGSSPLVSMQNINATWLRHNMTLLKSKGISRAEGFSDEELPSWILSAMKCLVNWPNSSDSVCNIPNYPGVEMDVFKVVREFFSSMVIPLIPYDLYDPIVRLYIGAEFLDIVHRTPDSTHSKSPSNNLDNSLSSMSTYDSVEDLILNISVCANQQSSTPCANEPTSKTEKILSELENNSNYLVGKMKRGTKDKETAIKEESPYQNNTPLSCRVTSGFSSIPRSLKLNKLQDYTNFKDSVLYNNLDWASNQSIKSGTSNVNESVSASRMTVKSLKNRSKSASRCSEVRSECSSSSCSSSRAATPLFKDALKTDELEDFSLPPNSCFETAFTSDSPRTRIIPQKSVDTIHFRNSKHFLRPKSIAVSLTVRADVKSCSDLDRLEWQPPSLATSLLKEASPNDVNCSLMNRSLSEGNLIKTLKHSRDHLDALSATSSGEKRTESGALNAPTKKSSSSSKSSLAARVRDSIKRKKGKDSAEKAYKSGTRNGSYLINRQSSCSPYENVEYSTPLTGSDLNESRHSADDFSSRLKRLRTKSGGYTNPGLSLRSFSPSDSQSIKSSASDFNPFRNTYGGFINPGLVQSKDNLAHYNEELLIRNLKLAATISSDSVSGYSDNSSVQWKSDSPSLSSSATPDVSFISSKKTCCSKSSRSCTPDGCLSHSMASSSVYHSALSGLNQTVVSASSMLSKPSERQLGGTLSPPPTLPKRKPIIQMSPDSAVLHDYLNGASNVGGLDAGKGVACKSLSSSANELSDDWADRTPFGTVPPYLRGGLWRHYHSSPRLLTKVGKESCIEVLQVVLLMVEPGRRRKLYLLLKMMSKVAANEKLHLDQALSNRALMVKTFARRVLLTRHERDLDEMIATRIVTFLMDNHAAVFTPPQHLPVLVHRKLNAAAKVSPRTYDKQKFTGSQQFLADLLDQIMDNPKLSDKEKKKKLKEFKLHYPEIYEHQYPPGKENGGLPPPPPQRKSRLRGLKKFASIKALTRSKSIRI